MPAIDLIEEFLRATTPVGTARTTGTLPSDLVEVSSQPLLMCTRETLQDFSLVPGMNVVNIDSSTELSLVLENLDLNSRGFDPSASATTVEDAASFAQGMGAAMAFTARLDGHGAAAGMYLAPHGGTTELVGIATLEPMRGKGIGAALTAVMTAHALDSGLSVVFLVTDNPAAQRVYERVGFRVAATLHEGVVPTFG